MQSISLEVVQAQRQSCFPKYSILILVPHKSSGRTVSYCSNQLNLSSQPSTRQKTHICQQILDSGLHHSRSHRTTRLRKHLIGVLALPFFSTLQVASYMAFVEPCYIPSSPCVEGKGRKPHATGKCG